MPLLAVAPGARPVGAAAAIALAVALPARVLAHGTAPAPASGTDLLAQWSFDLHEWLPLLGAALLYEAAARHVNRRHPNNPVPRRRRAAWAAGVVVLLVALQSPIGRYDTTLFSVHMVQHLLMTLVAAPLFALGAPITLLLRAASPTVRRRALLPVLHSRPVRVLSFPVVSWLALSGVMWAAHFSPLFDAALESEGSHLAEHALFMGAALLFWWPVVGADPSPWRLPYPARIAYLFLGMPQSTFLGLAILSAPTLLYPHYATLSRSWGPSPLEDQQLAGAIMWGGGDVFFVIALSLAVLAWFRAEEAEGRRVDAQLDRARAAAQARGASGRHVVEPPGRAEPAGPRDG